MINRICLFWPGSETEIRQILLWAEELGLAVSICDTLREIDACAAACIGVLLNAQALGKFSGIGWLAKRSRHVVAVSFEKNETGIGDALRRQGIAYIWGRGLKGCRWALRQIVNNFRHRPDEIFDEIGADLFIGSRSQSAKLIVVLHGGFWRPQFTRDITHEFAALLANHEGVVTCNIEYPSLFSTASVDEVAQIIVSKIGKVYAEISGVHCGKINEVFLVGHSAGGFFALCLAGKCDATFREAGLPLAGIIAISAVSDIERAQADKLGDNVLSELRIQAPHLKMSDYSPISLANYRVPILLIHGSEDETVPFAYSQAFHHRHADYSQLVPVPSGSHMNVTRTSGVSELVVTSTINFINGEWLPLEV